MTSFEPIRPVPPMTTIFMTVPFYSRRRCGEEVASLLRDQDGRALVLEEEHHELGRLRLARVAADGVNVVRTFVESVAGLERHFLPALHLHDDGTFQYIEKRVRVVPMGGIHRAGRILDSD